mmetsp:Transcript_76767/g.212101  ORF Transcript_76767/g.212101 Transcript_76767/m.212101 type:complete len:183 (-) Transcript_76767:137-685(-)
MRKLKYHEQKLLKKVNFYEWKDNNRKEVVVLKKYGIKDREDYTKYNKVAGLVNKLVAQLRKLPANDSDRIKMTEILLQKLYSMALTQNTQSLEDCLDISASKFCRRRLAVVLVHLKFCQDITQAVLWVQQGHFRIGPDIVSNPAVHVTREMEDHITWAEGSKVKQQIREFNDQADDYELLGN